MKVSLLHTVSSVYNTFAESLRKACPIDLEIDSMVDEWLVFNAQKKGFFPPENYQRLYLDLMAISLAKPDVVVVTCSSLSEATEEMKHYFDFPIICIDDAMCRQGVEKGRHIAVLATAPTTIDPTVNKLMKISSKLEKDVKIDTYLDTEAMTLLKRGDVIGHDARLAELARTTGDADLIILAQASMATAKDLVIEVTGKRVLTSPDTCIAETVRTVMEKNDER